MKPIPEEYRKPCEVPGTVTRVDYGEKFLLLYTPAKKAEKILYLIHGGGGDQYAFFRAEFLNMVDHMVANGDMQPMYIVAPCFYDPDETDKKPGSSGKAVKKFMGELRSQVIPAAEQAAGRAFDRGTRAISGFSMGGVTTWYAFMEALDLFSYFAPLSGDCWALGEKGGGGHPEETAAALAEAIGKQGGPDFEIYAITGSKDIAYPNLDPQIQAMKRLSAFAGKLRYDVLEGGVHDYETIFRYLYHALPDIAGA